MQHNNFIKEVKERCGFESRETAIKATRSALDVLSKRLINEEAEHLKAQLPDEMKSYISIHDGGVEKLTLREFFERIGEEEGTDPVEAEKHSRIVFEVLSEAITSGEIRHIKDSLPKEYDELFVYSEERK